MQIQVNTNQSVQNKDATEQWAKTELNTLFGRFKEDITRIEVHLSDENGDKKSTDDKRCVMEARMAKHQPLAVTHNASSVDEAFRGAAAKLKRLLESTIGKLREHDRESIRHDTNPTE